MTDRPGKPSLRQLAKILGCSHSSLSQQVHDGILTRGVSIGPRGKVIVTDIEAAARAWRGQPALAALANVVIIDPVSGYDWRAVDLLASEHALDLIAHVLIKLALASDDTQTATRADVAVLLKRITSQLHEEAPLHDCDSETVAYAERVLASMVDQILHPEPDDEPEETHVR